MDLYIFLLCFVAVPPTLGDNLNSQTALELDRARSAWNFGGYHPVKKAAYWNRPKNVAGPGSILANRRIGSGNAPMAPHRKKSQSPSQRRRQQKPYPKSAQPGRTVAKRNTNFPFPPQPSSAFPQTFPTPYYNNQQRTQSLPWHRASRKLKPTVDTIKSRFMKEDLWHLDKGESYVLRDEDLERDNRLRNRHYESNEIDSDQNDGHDEHAYLHQLEKDAEKMANHAEKVANYSNLSEKDTIPQHIHHHHHYELENNITQHPKAEHKKKPTDPTKVIPVTLPRIHNPIPLGCLLAVPVFHPIRPRHHLACLLSIPGTPSLTRRRRRRSADFPQVQIPTQTQGQNLFQQLFGSNSRMTPIVTRKHYTNHVGNGKNPGISSSPPPPPQGNYKVPATIIAPPRFDKDEVLSMLLGSGGVSADKMGTIVATENRYVRFGRGLPNTPRGTRQGRNLQWMTDSGRNPTSNNFHQTQSLAGSSSTHIPSVTKFPPPGKPYTKSVAHLTPVPKVPYTPQPNYPQPPLILNVQISPMPSQRLANGPVITVPVQQQQPHSEQQTKTETQQQSEKQQQTNIEQQLSNEEPKSAFKQQQEHSPAIVQQQSSFELQEENQDMEQKLPTEAYQTVVSPSGKTHKFGRFKYADWMPMYLKKEKPQKAYNYYSSSINSEPSESKRLHRKVKPIIFKLEKGVQSFPGHHENVNDQLVDSSSIDTLTDYYSNFLDFDNAETESYSSGYSPDNSWKDNQEDDENLTSEKSLSYAVKNNYKDELDNVLQDISSKETGIYTNGQYAEENSNMYDSINYSLISSSDNLDSDNNVYSQEKYYTVKRVPDHLPDPIFISVPKENDFSNELYDVKK